MMEADLAYRGHSPEAKRLLDRILIPRCFAAALCDHPRMDRAALYCSFVMMVG